MMVSGYEIEEGVLAHPAVADCAAIGVPDGNGEEEVAVFVTLAPRGEISLEALREHCRARMSRFMIPSILRVLDDMPRTPTGKPAKAKLRELARLITAK